MIVCSKTTTQILAWMVLFAVIFEASPYTLSVVLSGNYWIVFAGDVIAPAALFLLPLGGILGDVYWGRYKTVVCGMALIALSMFITSVGSMLAISKEVNSFHSLVLALTIVAFLFSIFGFSFFGSNILQFALDQLMDEPSESLGVQSIQDDLQSPQLCKEEQVCTLVGMGFFYWASDSRRFWCISSLYEYCSVVRSCYTNFLFVSFRTCGFPPRSLLHKTPFQQGQSEVQPVQDDLQGPQLCKEEQVPCWPCLSVHFAHCYDFRPSRLDYAKERYGGPFTTSDVEDVKAFKNVFVLLISFGLFFVLEVLSVIVSYKQFFIQYFISPCWRWHICWQESNL